MRLSVLGTRPLPPQSGQTALTHSTRIGPFLDARQSVAMTPAIDGLRNGRRPSILHSHPGPSPGGGPIGIPRLMI